MRATEAYRDEVIRVLRIDHEALLRKFVRYVTERTGRDMADPTDPHPGQARFTTAEWEELRKIAREA